VLFLKAPTRYQPHITMCTFCRCIDRRPSTNYTSISLNQTVACGAMCYCYHVGPWHVLAVITRCPSNERVTSVFCRAEVASILSGSLRGVLHCQKIDHARLSSRTSSPRGRRRCHSCSPPSAPTGCKLQLQRSTCSGR